MKLNELNDNQGARKSRTRVGRGIGSGKGKTAGRGVKGQKSRSGVSIKGFEGGQMPIHRRLPKRGFNNINSKTFSVINLADLQKYVDAGKLSEKDSITGAFLIEKGFARKSTDGVKLLAKGTLKAKLNLTVDKASEAAVKAVEKAGGKVTLAPTKVAKVAGDKADKAAKKTTAKKPAAKKPAAKATKKASAKDSDKKA